MSFVESNTTTLGLGIAFDSDFSSIPSSPGSAGSIFSDIALLSSASDEDSSPALGDLSDEDNLVVHSDDDLNIYRFDLRALANQQLRVADMTWSPEAAPLQPIRRGILESFNLQDPDAMEGYESDADDQLDELLWRRTRAKRRRAHRSDAHHLVEQHEPHEPVFEMLTPFTPAHQAAQEATTASQDPVGSSAMSSTAVEPDTSEIPIPNSVGVEEHVEQPVPDVHMEEPQEFAEETEFSRLMGQMDMPSESDSDYAEFYSSDEEHPRAKRVHYTSQRLVATFIDLPPITEEEKAAEALRRVSARGIPMENSSPVIQSMTPDEASEVSPAPNSVCSSEGAQRSASSLDSMEAIDLNTSGDEDQAAHTDVGSAVQQLSPASIASPVVQLGPFCVLDGPLRPIAGMLCASPISEKRRRSLEKAGLLPTE
ncbi:hypothetical protein K466DRAFT_562971 [Polyporus arcularius HHB13444]|uniref:Uncharacterized protein n=1 Tax=Polyporus arcularius HHB13444 TaxID=1314778 RepID=A0A5C3PS36_9APHY|nr:hypothetical protein K466DRAFT_562971 [Polyporus arcularius HHB13444]